jgi:hypothetical protein
VSQRSSPESKHSPSNPNGAKEGHVSQSSSPESKHSRSNSDGRKEGHVSQSSSPESKHSRSNPNGAEEGHVSQLSSPESKHSRSNPDGRKEGHVSQSSSLESTSSRLPPAGDGQRKLTAKTRRAPRRDGSSVSSDYNFASDQEMPTSPHSKKSDRHPMDPVSDRESLASLASYDWDRRREMEEPRGLVYGRSGGQTRSF